MTIRSNTVYRFTLSNPKDEPEHADDFMRQRYNGADVLVLGVGVALAEVEALDGSTFRAWHHELRDEAATAAERFASHATRPMSPDAGPLKALDSKVRSRATLTRDIDVAESTAARSREIATRQPHPALAGELRHAAGFAEGVAAYARLVRDGEASDELAKLLDF